MQHIIVLTVALLSAAQAMCPPWSCDRIDPIRDCPVIDACDGRLEEHGGGICGCCPQCIRLLGENEPCQPFPLLGGTLDAMCDVNLKCHMTHHVCKVMDPTPMPVPNAPLKRLVTDGQMGPCDLATANVLERLRDAKAKGETIADLTTPDCDENGDYVPLQCHWAGCYCVHPDGTYIEGSDQRHGYPTCPPTPMPVPNAPLKRQVADRRMGPCDLATANVLERLRDAKAKGETIADLSTPNCDENGDYVPLQCHWAGCYCVHPDGTYIEGSDQRHGYPTCPPTPMPVPTVPLRRMVANGIFRDINMRKRLSSWQLN